MEIAKNNKSTTRARRSRAKRTSSPSSLSLPSEARRAKGEEESLDSSTMRQIILDFPRQFQIGLEAVKNTRVSGKFNKVLVCAMGGSALPADILNIWLTAHKIVLPLYIHRNYDLPYYVDKKHLIICISYSGNTEEVLSSFRGARARKYKIIAITSGGKLAELCQKYKIPAAIIPAGFQPRMALGFQFAALIKILVNCGLIKVEEFHSFPRFASLRSARVNGLENILTLEKNLKPEELESQGKKLAKKLKNKIPLIYASDRLAILARIWKIKFNENSKTSAFSNCFPELNHNEITGFEGDKNSFHIIILRDPADRLIIRKRMELTAEILKSKGIPIDFIEIQGRDILYKIFSNILLGDWTSYWLAIENKVDPISVKIIDEFKKKLKQ